MSTTVIVPQLPPCDVCAVYGGSDLASYDGKTKHGPWAYMCELHFQQLGVGLGTGRGQKLIEKKEA